MYAVYRELHPPTGVEHCLECHFFDLEKSSLVVASTSALRVYNLSEPVAAEDGASAVKRKLVQCGEYRLYGNVQSIGHVRLQKAERDSLLLSFSPAKLSVVEYDPENNDLKTVSLHFFEDDEDIKRGLLHNFHRPYLRVDPEQRCAAMLIYGTHLAVLPFRQGGILDDTHATTAFLDDVQPTTPLVHSEEHHAILPSYTVELQALTEGVTNVKDFCFLEGYNCPTLFILYEPVPTWAGRITLRMDTHSMVAISLNTTEKLSPVIWHNALLPFDSCYSLPVPRPIGGVLVFGANTLIYMNQSSPSLGISLNYFTETTTNFQLRPLPGNLAVSMDCSHAVFVSAEQAAVALRGGEIYILTLVPEGRGLKNILFEKAAAGVLPSCLLTLQICCFGAGQVFIGSRLGNSLLLGYTKKLFIEAEEKLPVAKKFKSDSSISLGEDFDELEVYGSGHSSVPTLASFKFEVFDSILNIGPITNLTISQPAFLSFVGQTPPDLELVTCSGHGKNGALCVLQREVRPQVVTTFELPGCSDMWTVMSNIDESPGHHMFLILSQTDSTMVLRTGQEITELDSSGFATQAPTIYAGNMADGRYIIQVTSTDVRLLKGTNQLCRIALDMGGGVQSCGITDPYIVVLLMDGTVGLLHLQGEESPTLALTWPELAKGSKVNLISAYTDTSGLFVTGNEVESVGVASGDTPPQRLLSVDDEEELLYGDVQALTAKLSGKAPSKQPAKTTPTEQKATPTKSNWCAMYREDGSLEIYQLPNFHVVFGVRNFSTCPRTLKDSGPLKETTPLSSDHQRSSEVCVSEILLTGIGPSHMAPHLIANVDKNLVIYNAFPYRQTPSPSSGHIQIRFSKVQHKVIISDRKKAKTVKQLSQQDGKAEPEKEWGSKFIAQLRPFENVGGYSGVFVCGAYPHWLLLTPRGTLHLHPMFIDGPISSFAEFNNVNCPHGFLYFSAEGELRISLLPSHLSYDAPWPTRKVPTHCTCHFISYHMETKTHVLVTSEQEPAKHIPIPDTPEVDIIERDERFVWAKEDKFFMQLYAPATWQPIPNTRYGLERFERVVEMKVMKLRSQETVTGKKEFIVVGSTFVCGEGVQCKGKIRIFDVIEVIPEPGKPLTKNKTKCLYNEEQKGPISALEAVDGLLMACMGQRIYLWRFKDNKTLMGMAFIDTETYIHKALSIKNFILIADINRSVQLLCYKEHLRSLSLVSRDVFPSEVYACDFMIDGQQLGFIASDSDQNLILYQYQPELPESNGGLYLTRRGDFNAASHINTFFRVHCKSSAPLGASADVKALMADKRHVTFFATLDGGIGYLLPIPEKVYRRLLMLQAKLSTGLPHCAGLNPKSFRVFQSRHQYLYNPQRNILDGGVLACYTQLGLKQKTDFAKQIGTSPAQILDDLKELDKITTHF